MSDDAPKIMWSVGEIARRDGISKQAVSKIVKKLVAEHNIPVNRDGRGRISAVSLAHWDDYRGQFTNPAKKPIRDASKIGSAAAPDSFEEARRQNEWLKFERGKIEQQRIAGELVRADKLLDALEIAGREIQTLVARIENRADDWALEVSKEGAHGLRLAIRKSAFEINTKIADRLGDVAATAAKNDPVMVGEDAA